jgi:hypothetical protein
VSPGVGVDHLHRALPGVGDEDAACVGIEDAVVEFTARPRPESRSRPNFQRHDDLVPCLIVRA